MLVRAGNGALSLALATPVFVAAIAASFYTRKMRSISDDLKALGRWMRRWEQHDELADAPLMASSQTTKLRHDFEEMAGKMRASIELAQALAQKDPLTGLPNRAHFEQIVEHELHNARSAGVQCCLIFLDIDGFKNVNDTLGHHVGDEMIKIAAERLRLTTRLDSFVRQETNSNQGLAATAHVARLGGDEFTVFLPNIPSDAVARKIATRILRVMAEPFEMGARAIGVSASIGVAMTPRDGRSYADLLRAADTAMYHAKRSGRNRVEFYTSGLDEELRRHAQAEQDLRKALAGNQFALAFQPLFDCRTLEITSAEALIRWHHPERGVVMPNDFIPIAEKANLINQIGEWVISETATKIAAFEKEGIPIRFSVNVSPNQLQQLDFVSFVKAALSKAGASPRRFELEITESVAMQNVDLVSDRLARIGDIGVSVTIDDFGVGYSNLASLIRLPFSRLKLDRSLLQNLLQRPDARTLVQTIISMANSLGFHSVAEGVETKEQLELLAAMGCDVAQGFLLSQPVSEDELRALLHEQHNADMVSRKFANTAYVQVQ
jgi:diguanylate cyclase (GGDEF)-like protein